MAQTTGGKPIMVSMPQGTSSKTVSLSQPSQSGKPVTIQMPGTGTQGQTLTLVQGSTTVSGAETKDTSSDTVVPETVSTAAASTLEDKGQVDGAVESLLLEHSSELSETSTIPIIGTSRIIDNEHSRETEKD